MAIKHNVCNLNLMSQLKSITNTVHKSLINDSVLESFKGDKGSAKEYAKQATEAINKRMEELLSKTDREAINAELIDGLSGTIKRETIDILNTYKTINENIDYMDSLLKNAKDKSTIKGAVTTFFQRSKNLIGAEARCSPTLLIMPLTEQILEVSEVTQK